MVTDKFSAPDIVLGLKANWKQFSLLVVVNGFVGAMVGLERTILPLIASNEFGITSKSVVLSFLISFGLVKALSNFFAGGLADTLGRKKLLVVGWYLGVPVPFLIIWAPDWGWVVFANILLGMNQGFCWSMTVIQKIDLVGPARRGLAMGINEFAGYVAVSLSALATGYIAASYSLRPYPFYLGIAFVLLGLFLSIFFVKETRAYAMAEASTWDTNVQEPLSGDRPKNKQRPSLAEILLITSWKDKALFSCSQAGMVNNLNDGMAWGLFPLFFAAAGLDIYSIGIIAAVYPGVWGSLQLVTGMLSDRWGRKKMIFTGMWVQALGIWLTAATHSFPYWVSGSAILGLGTALVYPTLLAAISDVANPSWRASAVGVYRLWRDGGYALGALMAG
ncbi:MAG: MFS transporter, partial [Nitrospinae bacterium RIFCSPLOWO2_12_FULL_45_22]